MLARLVDGRPDPGGHAARIYASAGGGTRYREKLSGLRVRKAGGRRLRGGLSERHRYDLAWARSYAPEERWVLAIGSSRSSGRGARKSSTGARRNVALRSGSAVA